MKTFFLPIERPKISNRIRPFIVNRLSFRRIDKKIFTLSELILYFKMFHVHPLPACLTRIFVTKKIISKTVVGKIANWMT